MRASLGSMCHPEAYQVRADVSYPFIPAQVASRRFIPTGNPELDSLVGDGFELGITRFFYGDRIPNQYALQIAVHAQVEPQNTPTILIDTENMTSIDGLVDYCEEDGLEPHEVFKCSSATPFVFQPRGGTCGSTTHEGRLRTNRFGFAVTISTPTLFARTFSP